MEIYGAKRWARLKEALRGSVRHVALENTFAFQIPRAAETDDGGGDGESDGDLGAAGSPPPLTLDSLSLESIDQRRAASIKASLGPGSASFNVKNVRVHSFNSRGEGAGYPVPASDSHGVKAWYWLDLASLFPALSLGITPSDAVLDVCASPGGKSLVMAQQLFAGLAAGPGGAGEHGHWSGSLTCNELDNSRRARLSGVLDEYLPRHLRLKGKVRVTNWDGTKLKETSAYDKILVDAPCSSERHVLMHGHGGGRAARSGGQASAAPTVDRWSAKKCRQFAKLQCGILKSALQALKPGGRLAYSTCSIAPVENDGVIDKLLEKVGGAAAVRVINEDEAQTHAGWSATLKQLGCEPTRHGWIMLPDSSKFGPIYWCLLEKPPLPAAGQ